MAPLVLTTRFHWTQNNQWTSGRTKNKQVALEWSTVVVYKTFSSLDIVRSTTFVFGGVHDSIVVILHTLETLGRCVAVLFSKRTYLYDHRSNLILLNETLNRRTFESLISDIFLEINRRYGTTVYKISNTRGIKGLPRDSSSDDSGR